MALAVNRQRTVMSARPVLCRQHALCRSRAKLRQPHGTNKRGVNVRGNLCVYSVRQHIPHKIIRSPGQTHDVSDQCPLRTRQNTPDPSSTEIHGTLGFTREKHVARRLFQKARIDSIYESIKETSHENTRTHSTSRAPTEHQHSEVATWETHSP